jgi:acyl-CoA dehydrogenase
MIETTAQRHGDSWVLNGSKAYISNAGIAGLYTVFASTDRNAGTRGLSAFIVESATPGLEVAGRFDLIAPHCIGELRFRECAIPAENMLGQPGDGFKIAMRTFDVYRPSVGAAAIGMGQAALEEALHHASHRIQFGRPLIDNQAIQFKFADMATELDAARLLVLRAARLKDSGAAHVAMEASMAKLFATEAASRAIDEAVQIHGGAGVRRGNRVELLYRQVRALRIYEGASEIQRLVIARNLRGKFPIRK